MQPNHNKPWPTDSVAANVILVYGGLFFGLPSAVVVLFWVVERTGPIVAALIGLGIALSFLGMCALYFRVHGNRTAGSA